MKKSLLAVVVGMAMLIPSVAFADSTCGGYSQKACPPTSNTTTSPAPATHAAPGTSAPTTSVASASTSPAEETTESTTSPGTLPFTGLDVAALMVGASVLLGGGLVMRYLSRDQQS
jgi:hypothetical protein